LIKVENPLLDGTGDFGNIRIDAEETLGFTSGGNGRGS